MVSPLERARYRSRDSTEMKRPVFTRNVVTLVGLVLFGTVSARTEPSSTLLEVKSIPVGVAGITVEVRSTPMEVTSILMEVTGATVGVSNTQEMESSSTILEPSSIPVEPTPAPGTVRLVNGSGPHEGRVEIFYNGTWGTVCDNHWSRNDGLVVCLQLGYPGVLDTHRQAHFGEGTGPILFDNLICTGDESNLTQCRSGVVNCVHSEDAGVTCARESVSPSSTAKKLASISALPSITFMLSSAPVEATSGLMKMTGTTVGVSNTQEAIASTTVESTSSTVELSSIPVQPTPAPGTVRLVNGSGPHEGRVEIFYNGTWGTVCDNHWSLKDGLVVCLQLGYPEVLDTHREAHFGEGTGPILFDNLICTGDESNLTQCRSGVVNCDHSEDAGVTCARLTMVSASPSSVIKELIASTSVLPSTTTVLTLQITSFLSSSVIKLSASIRATPHSLPTSSLYLGVSSSLAPSASETVEGPSFSSVTGPSSTRPPSSFLTSSDQLVDHLPPTVGTTSSSPITRASSAQFSSSFITPTPSVVVKPVAGTPGWVAAVIVVVLLILICIIVAVVMWCVLYNVLVRRAGKHGLSAQGHSLTLLPVNNNAETEI